MASGILNRVSEICGRKRWNITDLKNKTGLSYPTAHQLWHGTARMIRFETLAKLADALDVEVGDIFQFVGVDDGDGNGHTVPASMDSNPTQPESTAQ